MSKADEFNLLMVHDLLVDAVHEDDDVKLKNYLDSYMELNK